MSKFDQPRWGGVIVLPIFNSKKSKILSGLKIGACLFLLSITIMSSSVFAYTEHQKKEMQNFLEINVSRADQLKLSDVKKALPFMSDEDAKKFLLNMLFLLDRGNP